MRFSCRPRPDAPFRVVRAQRILSLTTVGPKVKMSLDGQISGSGGDSTQPCSTVHKSYRLAVSNLADAGTGHGETARSRALEHCHFPPFSTIFLMIFSGFFSEPFCQAGIGRISPEKRWCESKLAPLKRSTACVGTECIPFYDSSSSEKNQKLPPPDRGKTTSGFERIP